MKSARLFSAKASGLVSKLRLRGGFLADRAGTTAVEFAMISVPFLGLIGAIFETGTVYFRTAQLQMATETASRVLLTRNATAGLTNQQFVDQNVCTWKTTGTVKPGTLSSMFDCSKLMLDVKRATGVWSSFDASGADIYASYNAGKTIDIPAAGEVAIVRIVYPMPVLAGILGGGVFKGQSYGQVRAGTTQYSSNWVHMLLGIAAFRVGAGMMPARAPAKPFPVGERGFIVKRMRHDEAGIAAVEFALLLPLMLMIYLGLVELSRGMRAAQKLDLVSHTLADLTAQILPISKDPTASCTAVTAACINENDVTNIFSAATTLMAPLPAANIKMTISEINITGTPAPPSTPTAWTATTVWSVSRNGALKRPCQAMLPTTNPPAASLDKIPSSYVQKTAGVDPALGPIIVADVIYDYSPGVHFEFFKWNSPPTWTMKRTSYAAVRNTFVPSHIRYYMTSGTNCNSPTP